MKVKRRKYLHYHHLVTIILLSFRASHNIITLNCLRSSFLLYLILINTHQGIRGILRRNFILFCVCFNIRKEEFFNKPKLLKRFHFALVGKGRKIFRKTFSIKRFIRRVINTRKHFSPFPHVGLI
jgi:hypothetical protein